MLTSPPCFPSRTVPHWASQGSLRQAWPLKYSSATRSGAVKAVLNCTARGLRLMIFSSSDSCSAVSRSSFVRCSSRKDRVSLAPCWAKTRSSHR